MRDKEQCCNCIHYSSLGSCMGKGVKASFDWCPDHIRADDHDIIM
jgi:hypothetical protein